MSYTSTISNNLKELSEQNWLKMKAIANEYVQLHMAHLLSTYKLAVNPYFKQTSDTNLY